MIVCADCRTGFATKDLQMVANLQFNVKKTICRTCGSQAFPWIRKLRPDEEIPGLAPPQDAVVRREAGQKPPVQQMIEQEHKENKRIRQMWGGDEPPFRLD